MDSFMAFYWFVQLAICLVAFPVFLFQGEWIIAAVLGFLIPASWAMVRRA